VNKLFNYRQKKYVTGGGTECSYCGSKALEGGRFDEEAGSASRLVRCFDCKRSWRAEYKLTGIVLYEEVK
jgi:hypothetical protein